MTYCEPGFGEKDMWVVTIESDWNETEAYVGIGLLGGALTITSISYISSQPDPYIFASL